MKRHHSLLLFTLFPAVTMLLGWGLRGYIGGGPLTAMIPGAQVALCIALLLRLPMPFAAILCLFGAVGVGYGGEMTYGQTIGLSVDPETSAWGILGLAIKGGAWGMLGGAMLGLGLCHERYGKRTTLFALLIMAATFYIGTRLVNDSMLIYFSNPEKPRFECWFGFYAAAAAMLIYLKVKQPKDLAFSPWAFAFFGLIGGVIGFGGGGFFNIFGRQNAIPFDWWKCMEFFFGFFFGAAMGAAAWFCAPKLPTPKPVGWLKVKEKESPYLECGITFLIALIIFLVLPLTLEPYFESMWADSVEGSSLSMSVARFAVHVAVSFVTFATLILVLGLFSLGLAWQLGLAFTLCHSTIDLTEAFLGDNGLPLPPAVIYAGALLVVGAILWSTYVLRRRPNAVFKLFFFLTWCGTLIGLSKSFIHQDFLFPPEHLLQESGSWWAYECSMFMRRLFVNGTFLVSAILSSLMAWRCYYPAQDVETD